MERNAARIVQRAWRTHRIARIAGAYLSESERWHTLTYPEAIRASQADDALCLCVRRLYRCWYGEELTRTAARAVTSAHLIAPHHATLFGTMRHVSPERCASLRASALRLLSSFERVCRGAIAERLRLPEQIVSFLEEFKAWQAIDLQRIHERLLQRLTTMRDREAPLLNAHAQRPELEAHMTTVRQSLLELNGERALEAHEGARWHARHFPGAPLPLEGLSDARLVYEMAVAPRFADALCSNEAYRTRAYWDALAEDLRLPHARGTARLNAALALVRHSVPEGGAPPLWPWVPPPRDAMDWLRRVYVALNREQVGGVSDDEREAWRALCARYTALSATGFAAWLADAIEMVACRAAWRRASAVMRRMQPFLSGESASPSAPQYQKKDLIEDVVLCPNAPPPPFDAERVRLLRRDLDALIAASGAPRTAVVSALRLLRAHGHAPATPLQQGTLIPRLHSLWARVERLALMHKGL